MCEKYSGYDSYETWLVKLWIDNEYSDYRYWQRIVDELKEEFELEIEEPEHPGDEPEMPDTDDPEEWTEYDAEVLTWDQDIDDYEEALEEYEDKLRDRDDNLSEAVTKLEGMLKEWVNENSPITSGMYADLLNAAISSVDFREIAQAMMED